MVLMELTILGLQCHEQRFEEALVPPRATGKQPPCFYPHGRIIIQHTISSANKTVFNIIKENKCHNTTITALTKILRVSGM
jgi:hypothetical protein